ncbi:TIGR02587 family membrane protein [Phormidium tenue FACHB-886]|nr:TIGR02587 family membrane protein [Phormidium tenue FACHB-886]
MKGLVFRSSPQDWKHELQDVIRGASGGFLFGIPLLYTMEVWWIGSYTQPPLMLGILAVTFIVILLLNRTDGFRRSKPVRLKESAMDSIEAMAIGIVCVTCALVLLREVTSSTPLDEALGKIIFEGVPFSMGVALARSLLRSDENSTEEPGKSSVKTRSDRSATLADIGATLVGTVIIAFNIAPTDEIPMLAAAASPPWLLAIIAASLIVSYCIVFAAGFTMQSERRHHKGLFQHPLTETSTSYLISLVAAAFMLWFFHRLDFADPWTLWLRQTILLGLPATIGGAAGRLTI